MAGHALRITKSSRRVVFLLSVTLVVDCGRAALSDVLVCRATSTMTTTCAADVHDFDDVCRHDVVDRDAVTPRHVTTCCRRRRVSTGGLWTSPVLEDRRASEAVADVEFDVLLSRGCGEDAACELRLLQRQRRC